MKPCAIIDNSSVGRQPSHLTRRKPVTTVDAGDSPLTIDCDADAGATSGDCNEDLLDGAMVTRSAEAGGGSTFTGFNVTRHESAQTSGGSLVAREFEEPTT